VKICIKTLREICAGGGYQDLCIQIVVYAKGTIDGIMAFVTFEFRDDSIIFSGKGHGRPSSRNVGDFRSVLIKLGEISQ
jgi:hypothetical protein